MSENKTPTPAPGTEPEPSQDARDEELERFNEALRALGEDPEDFGCDEGRFESAPVHREGTVEPEPEPESETERERESAPEPDMKPSREADPAVEASSGAAGGRAARDAAGARKPAVDGPGDEPGRGVEPGRDDDGPGVEARSRPDQSDDSARASEPVPGAGTGDRPRDAQTVATPPGRIDAERDDAVLDRAARRGPAPEPVTEATSVQPAATADQRHAAAEEAPHPASTAVQPAVPVAAAPAAGSPGAGRAAAAAAAKRKDPLPAELAALRDPDARRRQAARDAALTAKPRLPRVLQVVLALAFPLLLLIGAVRAVATPWFLWLAYNRPGFPADAYGFTGAERLNYGSYGVDYLTNAAGSDYLGGLVDGRGDPLFLATEVAHMADVKMVLGTAFWGGLGLAVLALGIMWYLAVRYAGGIRRGLFAGALVSLGLIAGLAAAAIVGWQSFFTAVHQVFFADGTWTFRLDDTLIRLYPPQFWVDAGIAVGALALLGIVVVLIATWPTAKRRERSRLRQEARDFGLVRQP
ncbi:DUF1461 domain-containing protein [Zafaria sp. Z1313]|uniref:DUF1461 domain-containing protein n=1 Tax=unclassified Zafaria TaxID=2828765 RepID=UPI002E78A109|nr:DUF1461 domain-containing protein [Zafaria sp. J156]MEE1619955.1 DUF1461 domain-containing protein [Zafaria sp. J156]